MSEPFLSPTETARRLGVGVRALRLYERKGLVRPGRTTSGWRVYGAGDIERLHHVLTLKSLGLSLSRIAQILGGRAPDLPALLALQEDVLTTRLHDLQRARKAVQAARATISRDGRLSLENLIDLVRETTMSTMDEARLAASAWPRRAAVASAIRLARLHSGNSARRLAKPELKASFSRRSRAASGASVSVTPIMRSRQYWS